MAIDFSKLTAGGISLMANFGYYGDKPLDSRLVVPSLAGLETLIANEGAYEGMIAYVTSEKKHYQVATIDGVISYKEFGMTREELEAIIASATTAAMEFKGVTAVLPENPSSGDMYKVGKVGETEPNITIDGIAAKAGDAIVAKVAIDGETRTTTWYLIPSADEKDTWRPVDGISETATLKFADGDNITAAVSNDGTVKFNHKKLESAPEDIATEEDKKTRTYLTAVEVDEYGHVTNFKTATENVENTDTQYTFTSQSDDENSNVYFQVTPSTEGAQTQTVYVDAYTQNEADEKFKAQQEAKDYKSNSTVKTVTEIKQDENGVITEVKFEDITFPEPPKGTGAVTTATKNADGSVTLNGGVKLNDHTLEDDTSKDDVTLHKVATTGSIYDVAEGSVANTGEDKVDHPKYIIFNCGSSKNVI